ncbi:MAG: class III signal peptide-containing protein [Methanosphaera sp.]|nr:class III signal peptide-containing protein [Methanosphaera sp.]
MINDKSGQVSAELILLIAGIIIIVLIAVNIYKNYLTDFTQEINDTEVNNLIEEIDNLNNKLK